jgi:hypothetical protein
VTVRTEPELAAGDEKTADQKLMALLPKPDEIDRQLREAKDQHVIDVFDVGLRSLRLGYARGSRSYLSIAASRFAEVTRLAPELALGYFNLGLARFYLDQLDDAQAAFQQAVKLDKSLQEDVPLLWWEDFREMPDSRRVTLTHQQGKWDTTSDGMLRYVGPENVALGMCLALKNVETPWQAEDTCTTVRFRLESTSNITLGARRGGSYVLLGITPFSLSVGYFVSGEPGRTLAGKTGLTLGTGWHVVDFIVQGQQVRGFVDGTLLIEAVAPDAQPGGGDLWCAHLGQALVDWVLVTRY